jgi:hypothetical protein
LDNFATWLKNLDSTQSPDVKQLQDFSAANQGWPTGDNVADYVRVISQHAPDAGARDQMLSTLAQKYADWSVAQKPKIENFRQFLMEHSTSLLLAAFGVVLALILTWGVFRPDFLRGLATPATARGLIAFLFSFTTIALFILIAIAIFWMGATDLKDRFDRAKDLLTLMIGIFGTILGFYFGSANSTGQTNTDASALSLSSVAATSSTIAPGEQTTLSATVAGGQPPLTYDLHVTDASGAKVDDLDVIGQSVQDDKVDASVKIPDSAKAPATLNYALIVHDSKGAIRQSTGALNVQAK